MSKRDTIIASIGIALCCVPAVALWLGMDLMPEPAPVVAQAEPCIQLADLRPRKAYSFADIDRLCPHQMHDERFHGNPKRVRP